MFMVFFVFFWKSALANPEKLCKIQILSRTNAGVAQLVERNLAKVEVASSRLVSRSSFFPPNTFDDTVRAVEFCCPQLLQNA